MPSLSSQVARAPQGPAEANCTSSLQTSGVWSTGVRWSSPPRALVSSSQIRHSLLDCAMYSRPLYSKTGPVTFMSRSRLRSQNAFLGANQSSQLHGLGGRVLLGRDDGLAEDLLLRKVVAVAAARVHPAVLADGGAESRPEPAARGVEAAHLLGGQVVRVELVRVAAAALRGGGVEHVVEVVEAVGLAVRGQERLGGSFVLPRGGIERPQPAVPRDRVDRVLARGRRGHDHRRRGEPARAEHVHPRACRSPRTCCRSGASRPGGPVRTSMP